jgi:hypothetical protein
VVLGYYLLVIGHWSLVKSHLLMAIFIADRFDIAIEQLCGCVDFFVGGGKQFSVDEAPIPGFSKPRSRFK